MPAPETLRCPGCLVDLVAFQAAGSGTSIQGCPRCGGQWLDGVRSRQVIRGLLSDVERALVAHVSGVSAHGGTSAPYRDAPRREVDRACPVCEKPMLQTRVADLDVTVDACPIDGTWFDPAELLAVIRFFDLVAVGVEKTPETDALRRRAENAAYFARDPDPVVDAEAQDDLARQVGMSGAALLCQYIDDDPKRRRRPG